MITRWLAKSQMY